jgi:hypothetical protein
MDRAWKSTECPSAVYGKQCLISEEGEPLPKESSELNLFYHRDARYARQRLTPLQSALVQQFPNDGYLLDSCLARKVRYRDESELGTTRWCDYEFSIRLAMAAKSFAYVDEFTSCYRKSIEAISHHGRPTYMYPLINSLELPSECEWARSTALARLAPIVTANHAASGNWKAALTVYAARHYGWQTRLSPRGVFHLARIAVAATGGSTRNGRTTVRGAL